MKIVIEIDELPYELTLMLVKSGEGSAGDIAVANGTLLPKNHGRLIDADAIPRHLVRDIDEIDKQPTIIEADTEESENE